MWYKEEPEGLKRDELLELYILVERRERSFREDLFRFTNFYSAVCYAILAVTLSGFMSLYDRGPVIFCLAFGPTLTLCMCFLGIRVTGRIYRRIIEEISSKAKLENALGLDRPLSIAQYLGNSRIWSDDECLLPSRHAKRRMRENTSEKFIEQAARGGFKRDNFVYFALIGVFSVLLGIAILARGLWAAL